MGAKQSKRSVDISGKEAENAGEVAAAGAGGEGRVETLADADADALKPQLNGDAHIQPPQDISDKEKQLDSGTPENEKDATTEKEGKEEQNEEKETTPVTNGDSEPKEENGDSVPTPEDGKKPKKEKVKKKWSLRSISFSRKDKPKQEKKPKEEEAKTNGEPEKVPEEAAEATAEPVENKVADVAPTNTEVKEEKTPSSPVTEPMTNGGSTPSSPTAAAPSPAAEPAAADTAPEQLPVNGLSLEEPTQGVPAVEALAEETKPEEPTVVATEIAPALEIPVKTEVCDAKLPLIEPTPPPLPANPPPSSVASFAATTMAPELVEASLANTAENAILAPPDIPDAAADEPDESNFESHQTDITNLAVTQISPPLKEIAREDTPAPVTASEAEIGNAIAEPDNVSDAPEITKDNSEIEIVKIEPEVEKVLHKPETESSIRQIVHDDERTKAPVETVEGADIPKAEPELEKNIIEPPNTTNLLEASKEAPLVSNVNGEESVDAPSPVAENVNSIVEPPVDSCMDNEIHTLDVASDAPNTIEDLPPPPPPEDDRSDRSEDTKPISNTETILKDNITNENHKVDTEANDITDEIEQKNLKNKKVDALGNIVDSIECNGNGISSESGAATPDASPPGSLSESLPPPPSEPSQLSEASQPSEPSQPSELSGSAARYASPELPPPEREDFPVQELAISDKIADLIPEIPTVPELKTETESAVAVAAAAAD